MTAPAKRRSPAHATGNDDSRHVFLIEMDAGPDALMRVLNPFAGQGAEVTGLDLRHAEGRMHLRIEAPGLDIATADQLGAKLRTLPIERGVGLGWRG